MGAKGIGKTINFIVYRSIQAKLNGIGLRIINVKQLETQFKIQGEAYIQELIDCDELLLDDIGSEPRSIKDFGTDRNLVNDILIQRYNRFQRGGCITHATTNLNVQMLTEHYDTRLIDRMKENVYLEENNFRNSKQKSMTSQEIYIEVCRLYFRENYSREENSRDTKL